MAPRAAPPAAPTAPPVSAPRAASVPAEPEDWRASARHSSMSRLVYWARELPKVSTVGDQLSCAQPAAASAASARIGRGRRMRGPPRVGPRDDGPPAGDCQAKALARLEAREVEDVLAELRVRDEARDHELGPGVEEQVAHGRLHRDPDAVERSEEHTSELQSLRH